MTFATLHSDRLRQALRPSAVGIDLLILAGLVGVFFALLGLAHQWTAPLQRAIVIDLSFTSLPKYTILSLGRGFAAYLLSLAFTLIYATLAAHNARAERLMMPTLDVLQAIPVLGFLPGLVIALVRLFPTRQIGLELACILMIFTGQVWNMTFSFHASLKAVPPALREAAAISRLGPFQTFRLLELPSAMIGLIWNSMMSMAGGWFFLTINEAFTLHDQDYRLPGIGAYMNEAINRGNTPAMLAAIVAMIVMIVAVDQLFWRPLVAWAQRFKLEDQGGSDAPQSWMLDLVRSSRLVQWAGRLFEHKARRGSRVQTKSAGSAGIRISVGIVKLAALLLLVVCVIWGLWKLILLLISLKLRDPARHEDWIHVMLALAASFGRTTAAVALAAAWALPAGILIGRSPKWSQRLQPITQIVASFPAPMLFPLVVILLHALHVPFTLGCIALMLLGAQWYILFNVIAGASAIPAELAEAADVYHMGRVERWRRLYLPAVFPHLITGLVTAAGGAWNATIVAEYLQIKSATYTAFGLGSLISHATANGNFPLLAASVVTMAAAVVLLNRTIWKRLYRLANERYSLGGAT